MNVEPIIPPTTDEPLSPFYCVKCRAGRMIAVFKEGAPQFTDSFICNNCQSLATIPTRAIIGNQIVTSLIGGVICIFLMIENLTFALQALEQGMPSRSIEHIALLALAVMFTAGFVYVLHQAFCGIGVRKEHSIKYRDAHRSPALSSAPTKANRRPD